MFLFIFESIGTSELLLIGIVALIVLGPRKMPQMARKIGKIMADFRNTTNEFKETWQREVNFDEEARALRFDDEDESPAPLGSSVEPPPSLADPELPAIKEVDPSSFRSTEDDADAIDPASSDDDVNDRKNWL